MQFFSVDQANRTLPLVRKIVEDVVQQHRRWRETMFGPRVRNRQSDDPGDKVEGLVRDNRVEVRVLFGAYVKAPQWGFSFSWVCAAGVTAGRTR